MSITDKGPPPFEEGDHVWYHGPYKYPVDFRHRFHGMNKVVKAVRWSSQGNQWIVEMEDGETWGPKVWRLRYDASNWI